MTTKRTERRVGVVGVVGVVGSDFEQVMHACC